MAKKNRMIFTDNKQSKRGIMSVALGVICLLSLIFSIISSYRNEGNIGTNYGGALFVTLIMSFVGLGLGIHSRMDIRKFHLLPTIGIVINGIIILTLGFLLWIGLR